MKNKALDVELPSAFDLHTLEFHRGWLHARIA